MINNLLYSTHDEPNASCSFKNYINYITGMRTMQQGNCDKTVNNRDAGQSRIRVRTEIEEKPRCTFPGVFRID
jgi:hypothetical protein